MQGPVVRVFRPGALGRQRPNEEAKYTALVKISTADFWSRDQRQNAILMILLAQSCTLDHCFVRCSALNGPKSDPSPIPLTRKQIILARGAGAAAPLLE